MSRPRLAVLAAVLLASCAGPTFVMAQAQAPHPHAAITLDHRARALDVSTAAWRTTSMPISRPRSAPG